MIAILAAIAGAAIGTAKAARRGGNTLDMLQYAAVYAIALGLLGTIATVMIDRSL